MARADYVYTLTDDVLSIIDLDQGGKSVTNDIDNVIADVSAIEGVDPQDLKVVYRDSDGIWDGYDPVKCRFIPLRETTETGAIGKLLSA